MTPLPIIYFLRVLVTMGCLLLPVWLQGRFAFVDHGMTYYFLWTAMLAALWLRLRWPVWLCLPAVFVAFAYSGYVLSQRDDIGYNEIGAILDTNAGEAMAYVAMPKIAVAVGALVVVFGLLCWLMCGKWPGRRITGHIRVRPAILYLVMVLCTLAYARTGSGWNKQQMYPANVITEGYRFAREVQHAKAKYAEVSYTYAGPDAAHGAPKLTAVIVVGESARAANWSLYGYGRSTNPEVAACLEKSDGRGMVFPDALSAGRLTMNSVPSILSPTTAKEFQDYCSKPSLLRVFRAASCRTGVMSSHILASQFWDGPVHLMLKDAASFETFERDDLLPAALQKWRSHDAAPRQLAVLHVSGSHYNYNERYPESFNLFHGGNEMVDTYDNSIAFTDHVLAGVIGQLDAMEDPAVMFYSSDHGENLNDFGDGNIQHSCREFTRYEIEVPLLFYANKAFAETYPRPMAAIRACRELPVSHDQIAQTLLGLAGLTDPQVYLPREDLSSGQYAPGPRYLIKNLREDIPEAEIRATPHGRRAQPAAPPTAGTATTDDAARPAAGNPP